jgi:hypothetical protein
MTGGDDGIDRIALLNGADEPALREGAVEVSVTSPYPASALATGW